MKYNKFFFISTLMNVRKKILASLFSCCIFFSLIYYSCSEKMNEKYLFFSKDYIFDTPEKVKKLNYFLEQFDNHWPESISEDYALYQDSVKSNLQAEVTLIAVLPNPTWDTVLFYTIYKTFHENNSFSINGRPICASFDTSGIKFLQPKMTFEFNTQNDEKALKKIEKDFKNMVIKSHYLNTDNSIDSSYWFRFLTDESFFFDDYKENGKKAEMLKKSRKKYFEYLLNSYKTVEADGKTGSQSDLPKVKPDYSGWEEEIHNDWRDSIGFKKE